MYAEKVANVIYANIPLIEKYLLKYYNTYQVNNIFNFDYYTIYKDVLCIDIISFNSTFLRFLYSITKRKEILDFVYKLDNSEKEKRVIIFGLLLRSLRDKYNINISNLMIGFRNFIFLKFINLIKISTKINIYRVNYDDIEFSFLRDLHLSDVVKYDKFKRFVRFNRFDTVVVLNKTDGIFYVNNGKIEKIKYNKEEINEENYIIYQNIIKFIINKKYSMKELNEDMLQSIIMFDYVNTNDDIYRSIRKIISKFQPLLYRIKY